MPNYIPEQMMRGQRHDPSTLPTTVQGHGNGGLFSQAGGALRIFSAMNMPQYGLIDALPVLRNPMGDAGEYGGYTSPLFSTFTGVTQGASEDIANQPTEPCQEGASGGLMKLCTLTSQYGRFRFKIDPIDLETVGDLRDSADPTDLYIANPPQLTPGNPIAGPTMPGGNSTAAMLRNEFNRRAFASAYSSARMMSKRIYVGNPANSTSSHYWKDILGLDLQINTGNKRDALTSNVCTALNSIVVDYGFSQITSATRNIVRYIEGIFAQLLWKARQQGLDPVTWAIVMRPELWDEIVTIWPVVQYFESLTVMQQRFNGGGSINLGAEFALNMRNEMRSNLTLPIRGRLVRVILDEFIFEHDVTTTGNLIAGQYASDIYFIPLRVLGNIPVTYIEPYNMANGIAESIVNEGRLLSTFTTDGGVWRWYVFERAGCVSWSYATRFRLICHTPQLGARLTNVAIEPFAHYPSTDPASPYFSDGGRTNSPVVKYYTEWSSVPAQF